MAMLHLMLAVGAGISCGLMGLAVSSAASQRLRTLATGIQGLRTIETGICVRGELLPKVLRAMQGGDSAEARAWAEFWMRLGEAMEDAPLVPIGELWPEVWEGVCKGCIALRTLTPEDLRLLSPLAEELGRTPRTQQQALFAHVIAAWSAQYDALQKKLSDTQRISQTLGLLGGLALFLLLL